MQRVCTEFGLTPPGGKSVAPAKPLRAPAEYPCGISRGRRRNHRTTPIGRAVSSARLKDHRGPSARACCPNRCQPEARRAWSPKSARRHVRTPITEKSRPSVNVERSVSTSCTKSRAAPGACVGLVILLLVTAMAVSAPYVFPEDPFSMVTRPLQWPGENRAYLLGSDMLGRDYPRRHLPRRARVARDRRHRHRGGARGGRAHRRARRLLRRSDG